MCVYVYVCVPSRDSCDLRRVNLNWRHCSWYSSWIGSSWAWGTTGFPEWTCSRSRPTSTCRTKAVFLDSLFPWNCSDRECTRVSCSDCLRARWRRRGNSRTPSRSSPAECCHSPSNLSYNSKSSARFSSLATECSSRSPPVHWTSLVRQLSSARSYGTIKQTQSMKHR